MATDNQKKFNIGVIVGAIINVIMNLLLIPYLGATGAAISSVCAEFIILILFFFFGKEYLKINIKSSLIKYVIASSLMYLTVVLTNSSSQNMLISMLIQIIIGSIVYFIVLIALKEKFLIETMETLKNKVMNKLGRN